MVDRWMEKNVTDMPVIANPGTGGELVVGISDGGLPFVAIKDKKLIGFEIELAERFAAHLGKKVQVLADRFQRADRGGGDRQGRHDRRRHLHHRRAQAEHQLFRSLLRGGDEGLRPEEEHRGLRHAAPTAIPALPFPTRVAASFHSNIIQEKRYLLLWDGLKATVLISIFATILGTLLGALVCYMRMAKRRVLNVPARAYIGIVRGTPLLVLLMLIFYVAFASVNIDPLVVAIIAFGLNFAAYAAEIFRTGVEGIDRGQTEAGIAMGFSRLGTFLHIVLPQTVQRILPVYRGEFISLVKMTSIVGYIAVQDLTKASDIIRSRTFDAFFPLVLVAVLYFLIAWVLMLALEYVERATDPAAQAGAGGARMIKVEHLSKRYGDLCVLKDVSAEIRKGEVVSIIGPSGAGKSTFLRCLNLLEQPSGGSIHVDGVDILDRKTDVAKVRQKMNMVFQSFNLFSHLSALENLTIATDQAARARAGRPRQAKALDLAAAGRCRREGRSLSRTSSPAASSSGSPSRAASPWTRRSSSSTSRLRRSIPPW